MKSDKQKIGKESEHLACNFLQSKGLNLLQQNYFCFHGEIDLIMQDLDDIVFIEVRSRSRLDYGNASESINQNKMTKLIKTAQHFLQQKNWLFKVNSRFDIVAIQRINTSIELEWIKHAFTAGS